MKKLIISSAVLSLAGAVACFGAGASAAEKDAIQAKETAAWQAFKDKNADDFKKVVDKDIRCVYADKISNMEKELADMKKSDMKSFAISNYESFTDEPDVIVTTYVVKLEGKVDGRDISGTYNAGSVWKKEGNDWLGIFHTHIKQETAAK